MENSITCIIYCIQRISAILYHRNMVHFRHVIANTLRKDGGSGGGDDDYDDDDDDNNNNNNNNSEGANENYKL